MKRIRFGGLVRAERLSDGMRMRRQVCFRNGEAWNTGAIIYRGVVILNALGDRRAELLSVITRRDALSFRWIADESSFEQDCRDLDVPQDVKARVANTAIGGRNSRQNCGVNGGSQRDVLAVERIAGMPFHVGARDMVFA